MSVERRAPSVESSVESGAQGGEPLQGEDTHSTLDARRSPLRINVVTIFPQFFAAPLALSIPERARAAGSVEYRLVDLRDFTHDRHRTVDDAPFGGGPGMVMRPAPFFEAVEHLGARAPIVLLSPRGRTFTQADANRFAGGEELTLLCGHYKDVDQRVAEHLATEELSLGEFVLSGGEPAALAIVDAVVRLLPGAMSDHDSAYGDSWYGREVSAPSYTRPAEYRGHAVPPVLLSGDHAKIAAWREWEGRVRSARRAGLPDPVPEPPRRRRRGQRRDEDVTGNG
ncbi:tRNA (guanosine(37)-N1)-methyltransferase TrmD [Roseisolibacter sp. H3M3-2]|uniref:tRNA (guanosine(37)-N1)-methyltransferase TrmD n=1 Tax=Roseisolibacter sp. H3M3-2 TaxID=3031323 RepID=UPI0023DA7E18|nr:tRNA (guanosine(37)-N1)-methyltransferase TrmD [Roseisolibacter sp. H3M3-2]MDF1501894.1 tRNA (guanosine(37)-N1)-methyltransferase TrmD [Roseisolibacter sp. H3M3-2]